MSDQKMKKLKTRNRNITLEQHIGNRLLLLRHSRKLSLEELSSVIGVSYQQLQKYEQGKNRISASTLYQFARYFDTTVDFFYEDYKGEAELVKNT